MSLQSHPPLLMAKEPLQAFRQTYLWPERRLLGNQIEVLPRPLEGARADGEDPTGSETSSEQEDSLLKFSTHDMISKAPPPPPPRLPLDRQKSEPSRRSIFGPSLVKVPSMYESSLNSTETPRPPFSSRKQSTSISIPITLHAEDEEGWDILRLIPVPNRTSVSRPHFKPIQTLPRDPDHALPTLPSPLRRFYSKGTRSTLGGVYPLNIPKSILRESSYRSKIQGESQLGKEGTNQHYSHEKSIAGNAKSSFNLTHTLRKFNSSTGDEETCSSCSSSKSDGQRHVRFDPRITITEFADKEKRQWFSDADLDRFKQETVYLAQRYLLKHPEYIPLYNKPALDPVTGTMRKRALFSLPILQATEGDETLRAMAETKPETRETIEREVKNILIVDRNKMILDLFRRSIQGIFPKAHITIVQSGEEALRRFQSAIPKIAGTSSRGYDIVIAEELLQRPVIASNTEQQSSDSELQDLPRRKEVADQLLSVKQPTHVKHSSLTTVVNPTLVGMSGSEVFRRIVDLEDLLCSTAPTQSVLASEAGPTPSRALLIGVSAHPEKDGSRFRDCGADLVWGKPPPPMGEALRDELVAALIHKRQAGPGR